MQAAKPRDAVGARAPDRWTLLGRSGIVAAMKAAQAALMLIALALAARWLGAPAYGRFATILASAGILAVLAQVGLPQHLLRRVATLERAGDAGARRALLRQSVGAVGIAGAGIVGCAVVADWAVADRVGEATAWPDGGLVLGALAAASLAMLRVLGAWLQARGRVVAGQLADALIRPAGLAVGVAAAIGLGWAPSGTTAGWLFVTVSAAAALVAAVQVHAGEPRGGAAYPREACGISLASTAPLLGVAMLHAVMANADVLMLGAIAGDAAAGAYHAASRVALVLGLAMAAVGTVTGPPLARAAAAADTAELRRIAVTSARGLAAPAALALPGVALAGAPVLAWLGTGFAAAAPALVALWIGQLANLACGPVAVLLTCHERERAVLAGVALGAAANVGLNALLIPPLGATGAAIATAASTALWNVVLVVAVRRRIGVDPTVLGRRTRAVAA
jgi:O-antigen/teichoic acid export membrane protein